MEQPPSFSQRPKPYRVPRLLPPRDIPGLGPASLQGVIVRTVDEAEKLALQAAEGYRANAFANLILSRMLIEPTRSPAEIDSLPPDAIADLVEAAAGAIGSRAEFDALPVSLPPRERLYQAYLEAEQTHFEKLNREITALQKSVDASLGPIHGASQAMLETSKMAALSRDDIDQFVGRAAAISAALIPDDAAALRMALDKSLLSTLKESRRSALDATMRASLSELVDEAMQVAPHEPFLSKALIASGINTSLLHSPTYPLPIVGPIESRDEVESLAEETQRQRLGAAYDILCHLEMTLREFIERRLRELHGDDWWESGVPLQIREDCENRKREKEAASSALHPAITYAYIDDLRAIIQKRENWRRLFRSVFANPSELETCFLWVGRVRNDIAHFRPIPDEKYMQLAVAAGWIQSAIAQAMPSNVTEE